MINIKINTNILFKLLLITTAFLFINITVAQPSLPQREITALPTQPINFGSFYVNGAGSIAVDFQGNVSVTGGVISLNTTTVTPAIFEIKLCQGRTVTTEYDYSVMLSGSNGGQLQLVVGPTEKGINGSEFDVDSNCNFITILRVGGKLIVPANAVPGVYLGSFPMKLTQK